ncbi:MAG TPA: hypothetical protein VIY69_06355 [Candidatus Acidoferrales bacterium]
MRLLISALILGATLTFAGNTAAQGAFPRIVQHEHATYPAVALGAQVQGDVIVKFTTNGQSVVSSEITSGPQPLQQACLDNVKTWKFSRHTPGTFQAIFRFKILGPDHPFEDVFPSLPNLIEIVALPPVVQTQTNP